MKKRREGESCTHARVVPIPTGNNKNKNESNGKEGQKGRKEDKVLLLHEGSTKTAIPIFKKGREMSKNNITFDYSII